MVSSKIRARSMILYTLRCDAGHGFEAWFRDSAAYDEQAASGHVDCPTCGSTAVSKAPMAPRIGRGEAAAPRAEASAGQPPSEGTGSAVDPRAAALRRQLAELRRQVEAHCDYVGERFAEEARRIHYGEVESRAIYGEASEADATALADEGIPVGRIPWLRREDG